MIVPSPLPSTAADLVMKAARALGEHDLKQAGAMAERAVQLEPDHAEGHHILGLAALELNHLGRALDHLQRAAALHPKSAEYTVHFARALARGNRIGEAIQVANIAAALPPAGPLTLDALGAVYMLCHAHERANDAFRRAAAMAPGNAMCHFNLAVTMTFTGDVEAAEAAFDTSLAIQPTFWRAYGLRSRLRRQTPARNHLEQLRALATLHPEDLQAQMHLHSALGKEYEDLGDYATAFGHFSQGKAAGRRQCDYASTQDEALVDAVIRAFPGPRTQPQGYASREPIFIVGMPRSGTTLVERIISSHPDVYSAGELQNFGRELQRLSSVTGVGPLSPAVIEHSNTPDWERLGLRYIDSTRPQTTNKPRFIDKLPHNFFYAGHIANALPHAKIICLRRHPMDTCLSNFREMFMPNSSFHGYSFDLLDIGSFYVQFDRLMAHWKSVMPGRILEVDYEQLIDNQESSTRQLLSFCELPWNDACLHFERNQAAVATASTAQVREPIYRSAVRRWEKYGTVLEPLEQLLNEAGIATRS